MAEEKAAEGNTTYFSEFSSDELDAKLKRKDEDGRTLLHVAAAAGRTELVELFLANPTGRAAVNKADEEDWTPLHSASSCGHTGVVSSLLAAGADPNAANTGGQRPIHYAASKGRMDVIRKLVAAGCEPDVADMTKSTPLHRAASQGRAEVIVSLTDGSVLSPDGSSVKCDVEAVNAVGQTPLLVACEAGQDEAALALARRGANLGVEDSEGANVATLAPKLVSALRAIKQGDAYL